jgi:hypothetical protein
MPHLSDVEIILLVVAGFYLFECFHRLGEGTLTFIAADGRHFRLLRAAPYFASTRGGILLSGVYPWAQTFFASALPVSLDGDGAYSYAASALSPRGRGMPDCRYVRFDDQPVFSAIDREVFVADARFLRASSPHDARQLADRLNHIAQTPAAQRESAIASLLSAHTDVAAARERLAQFRSASMPLALFSGLLLADTFLVAPTLLWTMYDHPSGWQILAVYLCFYLLLWALAIAAYRKLHRTVAPDRRKERLKHSLLMLVSPANTMRGLSSITTDLFAEFHPLAVARVLLADEPFQIFARQSLRDIRQPLLPVYPTDDPRLVEIVESSRARLQAALERLVEQSGLDAATLLAPPAPEGPDVRSWCPRCEQQYSLSHGRCDDCGGIELVPFADSGGSAGDFPARESAPRLG